MKPLARRHWVALPAAVWPSSLGVMGSCSVLAETKARCSSSLWICLASRAEPCPTLNLSRILLPLWPVTGWDPHGPWSISLLR